MLATAGHGHVAQVVWWSLLDPEELDGIKLSGSRHHILEISANCMTASCQVVAAEPGLM